MPTLTLLDAVTLLNAAFVLSVISITVAAAKSQVTVPVPDKWKKLVLLKVPESPHCTSIT